MASHGKLSKPTASVIRQEQRLFFFFFKGPGEVWMLAWRGIDTPNSFSVGYYRFFGISFAIILVYAFKHPRDREDTVGLRTTS